MTEPGKAEFDESSNAPDEPIVLRAPEAERQDTLVAAIDEILMETPVAGAAGGTRELDLASLEHISPNHFCNYAIGGVLTNAFAIGEIGASDRFYLIGAPAEIGAQSPILSGVLCDSNGKMLCRIERNAIVANPGNCELVRTNQLGFKLRDAIGGVVLHVQSRRRDVPNVGDGYVTAISGPCVATIDREYAAFGFHESGLIRHAGLDDLQKILAMATMAAHGKLYQPLHGRFENQTIHLDGKLIADGTEIRQCRLIIETGDFIVVPGARFAISNNELDLRGKARNVGILVAGVTRQSG